MRQIKKSLSLLNTLMENIPDSIFFKDRDNKFIKVNMAKAEHSKTTPEEMIGKTDFVFLPEAQAKEAFLDDKMIIKTGKPIKDKIERITRKDGSETWVSVTKVPWYDENGKIIGTMGIARDITDRKQDEQIKRNYHIQNVINSILKIALEPISLEEQLKRILELILAVPWLALESKGCIFLVEDEPEVLVMKAQSSLADAIQTSCAKVPFGRCLCGTAVSTRKVVFADCIDERHETTYNGIQPHGHYNVPILSGDKVLGVINLYVREGYKRNKGDEEFLSAVANILAGIIERKKIESEKQKLEEQLVQYEKLSALGRLTANVAHEIRNPLSVLGGFARRLYKKIAHKAKEKEYAEIIISEVDRLEAILRNVLTFSRNARLQTGKHSINDVIYDSLRNYEHFFRKHSIMIKESLSEVPQLLIDKDQIRETIDNLISNAIDSMPNGGKLSIITDTELLKGKAYVSVKITDTGEGISKDESDMIFEPFFTKKTTGHGTGLGLPICKKIIEDHNGFVELESIVGRGSTFKLYFPTVL